MILQNPYHTRLRQSYKIRVDFFTLKNHFVPGAPDQKALLPAQGSHLEHACLTPLLGEPSGRSCAICFFRVFVSGCYFLQFSSFLLPFVVGILGLSRLSRPAFTFFNSDSSFGKSCGDFFF